MIFTHAIEGAIVQVNAKRDAIEYASRQLRPFFTESFEGPTSTDWQLTCGVADQRSWRILTAAIAREASTIRFDRFQDQVKIAPSSKGGRVWHVSMKAEQVVEFEGKHIRLTLPPVADEFSVGVAVARTVRVLFVRQQCASGALLLHASGVVDHLGSVLFVGEKTAGKTTAMLMALQSGRRFLSNDQVLLKGGVAHGLPISINVRPGTPNVPDSLCGRPVRPDEIASRFRSSVVPTAPLLGLVVLNRTQGKFESKLHALTADMADEAVRSHRIEEASPQQPYWDFLKFDSSDLDFDPPPVRHLVYQADFNGGDISWILDALSQRETLNNALT